MGQWITYLYLGEINFCVLVYILLMQSNYIKLSKYLIIILGFERILKREGAKLKQKCGLSKVTIMLALSMVLFAANASATLVSWTDWTEINDQSGSGSGTLAIGASDIGVTLTGPVLGGNIYGSSHWATNAETPDTYGGAEYGVNTGTDMVLERGIRSVTLSFSQSITGLYIALYSVGQPTHDGSGGVPVSYTFYQNGTTDNQGSVVNFGTAVDVQLIASGRSQDSDSPYSYSISDNTITGVEFNGLLKLDGTFNSLRIAIGTNDEYYHGFNIGASPIPEPSTVPIPSTLLLMGSALAGLTAVRRGKKN
jgi:hypothetical protein